MPSPIGHALAGVAAAWAADLVPGNRAWRTASAPAHWYKRAGNGLTVTCAALAAAPDLDFLAGVHRTVTHSVTAVLFVGVCAASLAALARRPVARIALMCAVAYATHLLLDWLGADAYPPLGIQAFWPVSAEWYISGIDLFRQTARQGLLTSASLLRNSRAIVRELAILGPIVIALWLVRVKALAGLAAEVSGRHHPSQ